MSIQAQISIRTRKLGVLIRDARLSARRTVPECAEAIGVTGDVFQAYEEGGSAPALPELELLAYFLDLPFHRFWSKEATANVTSPLASLNLASVIGVRQRKIGTLLRLARMKTSITPQELSEKSGIPESRIAAYELGECPIPLPELESLVSLLGGQVESLFDQNGPVGKWQGQKQAIQDFQKLSPELQEFVCKPVNRPYLDLAIKLSDFSTEKLRALAENLLEITF
jgi:transcriptional regulator with XRE-family HTH domain